MARRRAEDINNQETQPQPSDNPSRVRQVVRHSFNVIVFAINIIAALLLLFTAYSGRIPPSRWTYAPISVMAFSFIFPICLMILVADLVWWRRTAWIMGLTMLACAQPIHDFMPLNLPRLGMTQEQKEHSFTLMSYNVAKFLDCAGKQPDHSRQLEYILEKSPDIVCVQESNFLAPNPENKLQQTQLDSLHTMYKYVYTNGEDLALFSKFEAKPINIDYPRKDFRSGDIAAWRLNIYGKVVNIFSVHLSSLGLSNHDKSAYQDAVTFDSITRQDLRELRYAVVPKIASASIARAEQIKLLKKYLGKYGGQDAIVCGDFNDPVGCYGLYLLGRDCHMRQAYADAGFGPAITFYANDLYFRIDHVLYRGALEPYKIRIPYYKASDHYPTITTFILNR